MPERLETRMPEGTQAIRRAAAILQRIARVSENSTPTLGEISRSLNLPRSTTHRILKCLTETGLAAYDPESRQYGIGLLTYELGLVVADQVLDLVPWRAAADRIAGRSGATTYLMHRSGNEAVCVHKAEGTSVIRVIPVEVGQRRYLGVGAGATALLATLDDKAVSRILGTIEGELGQYANLTVENILESVNEARNTGFAMSRSRAYRSIFGMGTAIPTRFGKPEYAISIAVHEPDVDAVRIDRWKAIMKEEIEIAANSSSARRKSG